MNEGIDAGVEMAQTYAQIFPDNFYIEIQGQRTCYTGRCQ